MTRTTLDNRICFGCVQYRKAAAGVTINQFYKVLVWSFQVLATGVHPFTDHLGRPFTKESDSTRFARRGLPLSGGFVGAFSEFRCDWKYMAETFLFKQMFSATYVCHLCRAHSKIRRLLFTDFRRDARVRNTRISHPQFVMWQTTLPPWEQSVLFGIPGWSL